jgi:hypothetical protein
VPDIDPVGVSAGDSSVSLDFFFKKLSLLFFFFSEEAAGDSEPVAVLVLERVGGVLPFGLCDCEVGLSATPKTCNASCHSSRNLASWMGVRFPGRPGGIAVFISEVTASIGTGGGDSVDIERLNARENPAAKPTDAPIATATATVVVQLMPLW